MGIVIVVSAFGTALPVVFQGELFPAQEWSILFRVHLSDGACGIQLHDDCRGAGDFAHAQGARSGQPGDPQ